MNSEKERDSEEHAVDGGSADPHNTGESTY